MLALSAMEAIANVRAKAKAKAEPKKMRLTPKAKAAADDCADVAAYENEGEATVRRSILDARKQHQADKRMYHKQRVSTADDEGDEEEAEDVEA